MLLLLSIFALSCGKKREPVLIMATSDIFPPFTYRNSSNQNAGFDIEIAKIIAKNYGRGLKIEVMDFSELIPAVQEGRVDMVVCAVTITDARKEIIDFSNPYYETSQVLIVRKERQEEFLNITSSEELGATKNLAAERGTFGSVLAKNVATKSPVLEDVFGVLLGELQLDNVDAIVMDGDIARVTILQYNDLVIVPHIKFPAEYYGIVVRKGNSALLGSINKTINEIVVSGTYNRLVEEHITKYLEQQQ